MPVTTIFREISRDVLKGLMFILAIDLLKKCHNLVNEGNIRFLAATFPICFFQGLFSVKAKYIPPVRRAALWQRVLSRNHKVRSWK